MCAALILSARDPSQLPGYIRGPFAISAIAAERDKRQQGFTVVRMPADPFKFSHRLANVSGYRAPTADVGISRLPRSSSAAR